MHSCWRNVEGKSCRGERAGNGGMLKFVVEDSDHSLSCTLPGGLLAFLVGHQEASRVYTANQATGTPIGSILPVQQNGNL